MYKRIMVPMDGSDLAECVLPHVETIIKGCNVPDVIFVRALEPMHRAAGGGDFYIGEELLKKIETDARDTAKDYLSKLVGSLKFENANLQWKLLPAPENMGVAEEIAKFAEKNNVDLIIISTHGRSGVSRWVLGSVADRILRSACVPVLMVRAPGCIPDVQP
ncbi:MAG: universal stress protein [Dehalococcoidales bacterium]|nr:universal stress protein [Dehalococcoidales bacterium]